MGIIDSTSITGLKWFEFGNIFGKKQSDLNFPYHDGYIKSSDVYAVTNRIAMDGASIPWILKRERFGEIEIVTEGELYDLIQKPNLEQVREEFVEMAMIFLLLSGEDFMRVLMPSTGVNARTVRSVDLLNPQLMQVETQKVGIKYQVKNYRYDGVRVPLDKKKITHLKYPNPTIYGNQSLRGLSPLVAGYLTLKGLNNNQEANAKILENQGAAGILSNESEEIMTDAERESQQGWLDKLIAGVRNMGKVVQSGAKVKFIRLGLAPDQLKLIESKIMKFI